MFFISIPCFSFIPEETHSPWKSQRPVYFRRVLLRQEVGRWRPQRETGHKHSQPHRLRGLRRLRSRPGGRDVWCVRFGILSSFPLLLLFLDLISDLLRGSYRCRGGVVSARSIVCNLRREVSGLPGGHVQRRDRGSEAAVDPCAQRNIDPHNAERGPAGHGAGCAGGKHTRGQINGLEFEQKSLKFLIFRIHLETSEKLSTSWSVTPTSPPKSVSSWLCWSCWKTSTSIPPTATPSGSKTLPEWLKTFLFHIDCLVQLRAV